MAKAHGKGNYKTPISLLLVEGTTEELFYERIKSVLLSDYRITIRRNMEGLFNINKKVINAIYNYCQEHEDEQVKVYCCLDRESRYGQVPGWDIKIVSKHIVEQNITNVLSIDEIIATQQIESWFLYDIKGIFVFLRTPKAKRNIKAFCPPEKYSYKDLERLFRRYDKSYNKGQTGKNLINHLDIDKIVSGCRELRQGIEKIKSQANDMTNHLFSK